MGVKQGMSMPRLILRVVLFCILGVMIVVWVVDRSARSASQRDFDILADMDAAADVNPMQSEIHDRLGREPDFQTEDHGGLIEEYHYSSILPGRTYRVLVAYANDGKDGMQYVDHFLNEIDSKVGLESQIWKNEGSATEAGGEVSGAGVPPAGGGGGGGGRRRFDPSARFASQDANEDGKLTGDEISDRMQGNLTAWDTDNDGAVTLEEFQARIRSFRSRGPRTRADQGAPEGDDNIDSATGSPFRPESDDADDSSSEDSNDSSSEEGTPASAEGEASAENN